MRPYLAMALNLSVNLLAMALDKGFSHQRERKIIRVSQSWISKIDIYRQRPNSGTDSVPLVLTNDKKESVYWTGGGCVRLGQG